jgi:ATP-dependent Clp protease ATP-binding subunit ClpA
MASPDEPGDDIFQPGGRLRPDLVTEPAAEVLREALQMARETRWDSLRSPHVFMGLLSAPDAGVRNWAERVRIDLPQMLEQFREWFFQDDGESEPVLAMNREFFSDNAIRLLREAHGRASDNNRTRITPMDLLITLLTAANSIVAECFERMGVTAAKLTELAVIAEQHTSHA